MNTAALLWLSAVSTGFASTLAVWSFLNAFVHRINVKRAASALWVRTVAARATMPLQDWIAYAAPIVGFLCALKMIWEGGWILALCFVLAGLLLIEPMQTYLGARQARDITPVMDLAHICMECDSNKSVLQILDEASATLCHPEVRQKVKQALESFYNGATEGEALQALLAEHTHSVWALLIWTLLELQHSGESRNLRAMLEALMRRRLQLHRLALPALEWMRRSLGITFGLCLALITYLTISPGSSFYVSSLQGQVMGSIALFTLVWTTCIWSARLETLQRIVV